MPRHCLERASRIPARQRPSGRRNRTYGRKRSGSPTHQISCKQGAGLAADDAVPLLARELFAMLGGQLRHVSAQIRGIDARLREHPRASQQSRRLEKVPSIGPVIAAALPAKVPDPTRFRSGRDFAAWLGLTPKDHSTAGKSRQGGITRAGDEMLRSLLICGASSVIQQARRSRSGAPSWLSSLLEHKPPKLAAVALANKTARIAWKMMVTGEPYDPCRDRMHHAVGADAFAEAA